MEFLKRVIPAELLAEMKVDQTAAETFIIQVPDHAPIVGTLYAGQQDIRFKVQADGMNDYENTDTLNFIRCLIMAERPKPRSPAKS